MRRPFNGTYPITRGFIAYDPNMPKALYDPIYGPTHRGVDWALSIGTPLVAAINGAVSFAGFSPDGAGNCVVIQAGNLFVKCFHMSAITVTAGQQVSEGDAIGLSGNTGNTTGPHLHFQVEQPRGTAIDPLPLITEGESMQTNPNVDNGGINTLYDAYFGRPADAAGIQSFVGQPWQYAIFQIATSPERVQRAAYVNTAIAFYEAHKNDTPTGDPKLVALGNAIKNYISN